MRTTSTDRAPSWRKFSLALGAPLALWSPGAAQECVQNYLDLQPVEILTACELGSAPCTTPEFIKYRVEGGGYNLQEVIDNLALFSPPQTSHYVIEVGPDIEPPPGVFEVYDPVIVFAEQLPLGLSLISKWGPDTVTIDGGGLQPAIYVDSPFSASGDLRIGLAVNSLRPGVDQDELLPPVDYEGWHGFTITNGVADAPPFDPIAVDGGGIHVRNYGGFIDISGNIITGNTARQSGGGIYLGNCRSTVVALNDITGNAAGALLNYSLEPIRGAGIYQSRGNAEFIANTIHANTFGEELVYFFDEPARQGGGLAADLAGFSLLQLSQACGNYVADNEASEGGGIWIDLDAHSTIAQAHLQQNIIRSNSAWEPGPSPKGVLIEGAYRGAGVWVQGRSTKSGLGSATSIFEDGVLVGVDFGDGELIGGGFFGLSSERELNQAPFLGDSLSASMFANRLLENSTANPGFDVDPLLADEVGGGLWSDVERNDATDRVTLFGNAAWLNEVPRQGAGMYLDHTSTLTSPVNGEIYHNTLAWNNTAAAAGQGSGVYLVEATRFQGSSNILYSNRLGGSLTPTANWFGEGLIGDNFEFTQMTSIVPVGSTDLFGSTSDTADPLLFTDDWHMTGNGSPVVDEAEDGIELFFGLDIDFHERVIDRFLLGVSTGADRGADEYIGFLRGDVNADGCIDLSDPIFLLAYLFQGGPTPDCLAAADIDNSGPINIADAIYLLGFLFNGGPPPPDFGICLTEDTGFMPQPLGLGTPCDCP